MHFFLKHTLACFLAGFLLFGCDQEKKKEETKAPEDKVATAILSKARYVVGDSIKVGFASPVTGVDIQIDGKGVSTPRNLTDTLMVYTKDKKTGWHQLIVKGNTQKKELFADTLQVELISDISPVEMQFSVIGSFPHEKTSFTEGLEFYRGELYEGTGQNGSSKLLKTDLKTGVVMKEVKLDPQYFGEGITIVKDKIYQLTWQSGICFRYNLDFTLDKTFTYYTQGWGMTHRENTLIMSDGSSKLYFYNTEMEKVSEIDVYDQTGPVRNLNELEYVDGFVYANIFESTKIVKIDIQTGKVVAFLKMDAIVPANVDVRKDVLNGIARQPSEDTFYITGKNWPLLFKIKLTTRAKNKLALK